MMKPQLLLVVLMVPWTYALLPPTNLTVKSHNFHHTLHWHPAEGAPPGTEYHVFKKLENREYVLLNVTKETSLSVSAAMKKDIYSEYSFSVKAVTHTHTSRPAQTTFRPFETELGPPVVHVEGCGDCLVVNIRLSHGDGIDPQQFQVLRKSLTYKISWRKDSEDKVNSLQSKASNTTISHLAPGVRYCLRVELTSTVFKHVLASDWLCTWTSPATQPEGLYLIVWSAGTVCAGVLLMLLFGTLCYTGAICRSKLQLPQSLIFLVRGFVLSPELVQIDTVCVSPECVLRAQRRHTPSQKHPPHGSESEEEEEEEENAQGDCAYMDRLVAPSASSVSSQDALGPDVAAAAWYHGSCSPSENMEQLQGHGSEVKSRDPVTPLSPDNTQAYSRERRKGEREIEGEREREDKKDKRSAGEMEEKMEREMKRDGGGEEVRAQERDERGEKGERDEEREEWREEEEKRGGEGVKEEDGEREERREREESDPLGDVDLFSVRLGGLQQAVEQKEEETDDIAREDQPLLNVQNTHTHRRTDEHTLTDAHKWTDKQPWTELRDQTHTHTPVFTHSLTPLRTGHIHTLIPSTPSHTQLPLLGQVRFHTNPYSHTSSHTHPHTQEPKQTQTAETGSEGSDGGSRHTGYLATQTGSVHTNSATDEEEEEEEDCSGYMTR